MSSIKPAIVVVGYNRPNSLKRLLTSISKARYPFEDVNLIISLDRAEDPSEILDVASSFRWEHGKKTVILEEKRKGLREHVISCGDLSETYGAVIILEDDLLVSEDFYIYAYLAINRYQDDPNICGISLYSHAWNGYSGWEFRPVKNEFDVFFGQFSITWGEVWSKNQWASFKRWYLDHINTLPVTNSKMPKQILEWNSKSWGKYFISYMVEKNLFYVIPYTALSTNFSDPGQHSSGFDSSHQVSLQQGAMDSFRFCAFKEGIKYDAFFERIFPSDWSVEGIPSTQIQMDLNGSRPLPTEKKYLLSTNGYPFKIVHSFGLRMHPIDSNVERAVEGDGIFLYDVTMPSKNKKINPIKIRTHYECYGLYWRYLFGEIRTQICAAVRRKIYKRKQH